MTAPAALLTKSDGLGVITLNRPEAMNAVNAALSLAVGEALEEIEADPDIVVAVITGAGRAFSAGADLKAVAAGQSVAAPGHDDWGFAGIVQHDISKPVIAAVNGFALGGGTEIVLACDLAVMSEDASLGLPEVKRGLFAGAGGVIRLPRQIPTKVAMYAALTGDPISAEEALKWGLVNAVVPADAVLDAAMELGRRIAGNAPLALKASKSLVNRAAGQGSQWDDDVWKLNDDRLPDVVSSADALEGARAFAEKRSPRWTGT